jgi:hypothetical protein
VASAADTQEDDEADNFREDVFACEEAVAHLEACCAALDGEAIRCVHDRHRSDGCDTYTKYHEDPAISFGEADCVLSMACAQIRERGICERAARMQPERSSTYHDVGHDDQPVTHGNAEPLCP